MKVLSPRLTAAILTGLLLLAAGCSTPGGDAVVLLDGRHVKEWRKADALAVPALSNQAVVCDGWVYVVTDTGMKLMYRLDIQSPAK